VKDSTYHPRNFKPSTSTPKSLIKTSSQKCFKCLGFRHIAANCPSKINMMAKRRVVMSDHSSQRSGSPTSSRFPSVEENKISCKGDLLVMRHMLGQVLKPFGES